MLKIIVGSRTRTEIIRHLFTLELPALHLRELSSKSGLSVPTLSSELHKFSTVEIVTVNRQRGADIYQANEAHPFFPALCDLVRREYGVTNEIIAALSDDDIYGVYLIGDALKHPTKALELCVRSQLTCREINRRLLPVIDAIGRKINLRVLNSKEFLTAHGRTTWENLKS